MITHEDFLRLAHRPIGERVRLTMRTCLIDPENTFVLEGRLGGSYYGSLIVNAPYLEDTSNIHRDKLTDLRREYDGRQKQIMAGLIESYQFLEVAIRK